MSTTFIERRKGSLIAGVLITILITTTNAWANVYATNIRLNGGTTNAVVVQGGNASISYILNEPATEGVIIEIKSGMGTLRTIILTNALGTARGSNNVIWDVRDNASNSLPVGNYSIHITAKATGYFGWTQISDDFSLGNYVWAPRGMAVNRNPASPYYGRVFVANAELGPNPGANPGDRLGLQKLNSDGSLAAEGGFSGGGYSWAGTGAAPWRVEVHEDTVYVGDFSSKGRVLSFDQTVSAASRKLVLRDDNWPNAGAKLSGPFLSASGTNTYVWMADTTPGGVGIRRWPLLSSGIVASNNLGATIVSAGAGTDLNLAPYDGALDFSNRLCTVQHVPSPGDAAYRVFRFSAYDESGTPQTTALWKIGSSDNSMGGAQGIAVDPSGTYVAVAFQGILSGSWQNGSLSLFYVTNGELAAVPTMTLPDYHDYRDVTWDNVGNVYVVDAVDRLWRAYSPPGTNQSTTVALTTIMVDPAPVAPVLSAPRYANGIFEVTLVGEANVTYILQVSTNLDSWTSITTNTASTATREIAVPAAASRSYYRARIGP